MNKWTWIWVLTGTAFLVFVLPYIMAAFGAAPPNGTETLLLVLLLWVATWMVAVGELERVQQLDKTRS